MRLNSSRYLGVEGHIGHTPLLRLRRLSELTGCEILGKAEFMNPGGSVKDRAALGIIEDAEARGLLRPGATIVEGTAGNTGIGLTMVGQAKGYRTVIVIPETQSVEKITLLRTLGAKVITVPEKPYSDPGNYNRQAQRLAEENGWYWANQFDNLANRLAHYKTTGPEIWEQTSGEVTGFVASVGTGGTLAGASMFLKEQNPKIKTVCADPYGAAMFSWFKHGNLETRDGDSFAEGIGQMRVTENLKGIVIDDAYRVTDQNALSIIHRLLGEEGIFVGLSSGINLAGALRLAKENGPGQVIVTLLCDSGIRYMSRIFNPEWLRAHGLTQTSSFPRELTRGTIEMIHNAAIRNHWNRDGLVQEILRKVAESGKSLDSLTIDDLAPFDQFHGGGKNSTIRLARLAKLERGMRVLDVGGGLGGPAR